MKGSSDGEPRDDRRLNSVIVLDISGSMGGRLTHDKENLRTRLELSKEAIKMFVSKLRPTDTFGLVTFNNQGQTLLKSTLKSELDMDTVFEMVNAIQVSGGTTLLSGFDEGCKVLSQVTGKLGKDSKY